MNLYLQLTARDPLIARDGRPFGLNQGQRMRGLAWPLPSVVAGSFRTALVKAGTGLDFSDDVTQRLLQIAVAGVYPAHRETLYLPAPIDAVAEPQENGKGLRIVHRVEPQKLVGECNFPDGMSLQPVMLSAKQAARDFKPADVPAWWPLDRFANWLCGQDVSFDETFLGSARQEMRDHVCIEAASGAAKEGELFATSGLNVTHLPRYGSEPAMRFQERFAEVTLTARVQMLESGFDPASRLDLWHPLGGERRLVHWSTLAESTLWEPPAQVTQALRGAQQVRMILATPAILQHGWLPKELNRETRIWKPFADGPTLELVGVSLGRWKAVSGWSMRPHPETGRPGPKAIRRMVPAGSVYFFRVVAGDAARLAGQWLQPISDNEQERRDGFGLSVWGIW